MSLFEQAEAVFFLVLAAFCGMIIGLDREGRNQPAGLRTHMLVGMGAALFTLLSVHAFPGSDSARVAAQIVTGIGFLGAGTIMQREGEKPQHLTTAASIWATAAVGMSIGSGAWFLGIGASVLIWIVLAVIRRFSKSTE